VKLDTLQRVLDHVEAKRPVILATHLDSGLQRVLRPGEGDNDSERLEVERALQRDACITYEAGGTAAIFYQPFNPALRMIVVGAVHVAQPLSAMASIAGYDVTVVDPRESFAAADRFPGVTLNLEWPDEALRSLRLDARCAVVTLTHDPKLDDPALQIALRSEAFYIGSLGSRKTHNARLRRLGKAGFSERELQRVNGPVGLPIGSHSPSEIAVSVLAEVTQTLRKPSTHRDRP
jgi:xanthine dehydrogenase accessory factor